MSSILSSNTLANPNLALYSAGNSVTGVSSVNGATGAVSIAGANGVGVSSGVTPTISLGAITPASVAAVGAISGTTVTASGAINGASVTSAGALNGASVVSSGGVSIPNAAAYGSSATQGQAPGVTGMGGSRKYTLTLAASTGNQDIGLNALLNDTVPHLFSVCITKNGGVQVAIAGLIQSYPAAIGQAPVTTALKADNGYSWNGPNGTPGAYTLGINTGGADGGAASVVVTMIY